MCMYSATVYLNFFFKFSVILGLQWPSCKKTAQPHHTVMQVCRPALPVVRGTSEVSKYVISCIQKHFVALQLTQGGSAGWCRASLARLECYKMFIYAWNYLLWCLRGPLDSRQCRLTVLYICTTTATQLPNWGCGCTMFKVHCTLHIPHIH